MAFGDLKGTLTGNLSSITNPFPISGSVSVAVGDLVYAVCAQQTNVTATAAADNLGNTYAATAAGLDAGQATVRVFYAYVTVAGTLTTVNFTTTASANDVAGVAAVIEGPFNASPLDANPAFNNNTDNTSPLTCPATGTLAQAIEAVLCFNVFVSATVTYSATSPNLKAAQAANSSNIGVVVGYQAVSATTSVAPEFTTAINPTQSIQGTHSFKQSSGVTGTGTLSAQSSAVIGSGTSISTGTGAFAAQDAELDATGITQATGSGNLLSAAAAVSGSGISESIAAGALAAQAGGITGSGFSASVGSGQLLTALSAVAASGVSGSDGSGAINADAADVDGNGTSLTIGECPPSAWGSSWLDSWAETWGCFDHEEAPEVFICDLGVTVAPTIIVATVSKTSIAVEIDCHG